MIDPFLMPLPGPALTAFQKKTRLHGFTFKIRRTT
jgi:hypothetical protein